MSEPQSRHRPASTSKNGSAKGSSSSAWSRSWKPPSAARNVALGSSPLTISCPGPRLGRRRSGSRPGPRPRAARRRRCGRCPARSSISSSPAAPLATSRCSSSQRSSVSTARPSMTTEPSSRPASRSRSSRGRRRCRPARGRRSSWASEPGCGRAAASRAAAVGQLGQPGGPPGRVGVPADGRRGLHRARCCSTETSVIGLDAGQHQAEVVAGGAARRRGPCPRPRPSRARRAGRSVNRPHALTSAASECSSSRILA